MARSQGVDGAQVLESFLRDIKRARSDCVLVAHNISFDVAAVLNELEQRGMLTSETEHRIGIGMARCDTMDVKNIRRLAGRGRFMKLTNVFDIACPNHPDRERLMANNHNAAADAEMAGSIFVSLRQLYGLASILKY